MAAADIFRALGAALQTGVGTYGALDDREKEQKLREEQLALAQQREERAATRDTQMLEGQEKDRQHRILMAAIEGMTPHAEASPELFEQAQEFHLDNRFKTLEKGTMNAMPSGTPFGVAGVPNLSDRHFRQPTLQEQAAMDQLATRKDALEDKQIFETWMGTEGAEADYDTRVAKALSLGQDAPPLTMKDREAQAQRDFGRRQQELRLMYPPDRFGPDSRGGSTGSAKTKVWDQNYRTIADDVRQMYSSELSAVAKAVAEGTAPPEALDGIRQRIEEEITNTMENRFGPRPVDTSELVLAIDRDAQRAQGYWNLYRTVRTPEAQAALRRQGVDVQAYLTEVKRKADEEATAWNASRQATPQGGVQWDTEPAPARPPAQPSVVPPPLPQTSIGSEPASSGGIIEEIMRMVRERQAESATRGEANLQRRLQNPYERYGGR